MGFDVRSAAGITGFTRRGKAQGPGFSVRDASKTAHGPSVRNEETYGIEAANASGTTPGGAIVNGAYLKSLRAAGLMPGQNSQKKTPEEEDIRLGRLEIPTGEEARKPSVRRYGFLTEEEMEGRSGSGTNAEDAWMAGGDEKTRAMWERMTGGTSRTPQPIPNNVPGEGGMVTLPDYPHEGGGMVTLPDYPQNGRQAEMTPGGAVVNDAYLKSLRAAGLMPETETEEDTAGASGGLAPGFLALDKEKQKTPQDLWYERQRAQYEKDLEGLKGTEYEKDYQSAYVDRLTAEDMLASRGWMNTRTREDVLAFLWQHGYRMEQDDPLVAEKIEKALNAIAHGQADDQVASANRLAEYAKTSAASVRRENLEKDAARMRAHLDDAIDRFDPSFIKDTGDDAASWRHEIEMIADESGYTARMGAIDWNGPDPQGQIRNLRTWFDVGATEPESELRRDVNATDYGDVWEYDQAVQRQAKREAEAQAKQEEFQQREAQIFADYEARPDYAQNAVYIDPADPEYVAAPLEGYIQGSGAVNPLAYMGIQVQDIPYVYANQPELRQIIDEGYNESKALLSGFNVNYADLAEMDERELATFNYKWNVEGPQSAMRFARDEIGDGLRARAENTLAGRYAKFADLHPGIASGLSVYQNLVSGYAAIPAVIAAFAGDEKAVGDLTQPARTVATVRGKVAADLGEISGILSTIYQSGMSVLDNLAALAMTGSIGNHNATELQKGMIQLLMSSEAMNGTLSNAYMNGMDLNKAVWLALSDGAAEAISERWSIEAFFSSPANMRSYIVQNVLAEGTEEIASDLMSKAAQSAFLGKETELCRAYDSMVSSGVPPKQAARQIFEMVLGEEVQNWAGGAMAGLMMSGPGAVNSTITDWADQASFARWYDRTNQAMAGRAIDLNTRFGEGMGASFEGATTGDEYLAAVQHRAERYMQNGADRVAAGRTAAEEAMPEAVAAAAPEAVPETAQTAEDTAQAEAERDAAQSAFADAYTLQQAANEEGGTDETALMELAEEVNEQLPEGQRLDLSGFGTVKEAVRSLWEKTYELYTQAEDRVRAAQAAQDTGRSTGTAAREALQDLGEQMRTESQAQEAATAETGSGTGEAAAQARTAGREAAEEQQPDSVDYETAKQIRDAALRARMGDLRNLSKDVAGSEVTENGKKATVTGVKTEDGELVVTVDEGGETKDVALADIDTADDLALRDILTTAKRFGPAASAVYEGYRASRKGAAEYITDLRIAEMYGRSTMTIDQAIARGQANGIDEQTVKTGYYAGQIARASQQATEARTTASQHERAMKGVAQAEGTTSNLAETVRATQGISKERAKAISMTDALIRSLGMNVEWFASTTNADGIRTDENGSYHAGTNTIRMDVFAGSDTADVSRVQIYGTMMHELTHAARAWAGSGTWGRYRDFVLQHSYQADGSFERAIEDRAAMYEAEGKTREEALDLAEEEIVADASAKVELDEELLRDLAREDMTLFERVVDHISEMFEKLRDAFRKLREDGRWNADAERMEKVIGEQSRLWNEMIREVRENIRQATGVDRAAAVVDEAVKNGQPVSPVEEQKYSRRWDTEYMAAAMRENGKVLNITQEEMEQAKRDRQEIRRILADNADRWVLPEDIEGDTWYTDSSYGGSQELTTVCPRSLASEQIMDMVAKELGRPLTVADTLVISEAIAQYAGNMRECTYCYVATDRRAYREYLGRYMDMRDKALKLLKEGSREDAYRAYLDGRKDTKEQKARFAMWEKTVKEGLPLLKRSDVADISAMGREMQDLTGSVIDMAAEKYGIPADRIEITDDGIYRKGTGKKADRKLGTLKSLTGQQAQETVNRFEQLRDAMKYAQAASWQKARHSYTAYNGHILNWSSDKVKKLNAMYGMRMYSFSDYSPAFVLENMQMVTDAAVKGLKILAYTKELDFAKIFAPTGMNINISCFAYQDKNTGEIAMDGMMGADWAEAQKLRGKYGNCGIVMVATNDAIVEWAMKQDWIDVVIPYHLVRTGQQVADYFEYNNYTKVSGDEFEKGYKHGKKDPHSVYPTEHNNDIVQYAGALIAKHLTPRFAKYIKGFAEYKAGTITAEQLRAMNEGSGYMKLVNETRRTNDESEPVRPVFDMDAARASLENYRGYAQPIGGSIEVAQDIAEEVAGKVRENEGVRKSERDKAYLAAVQSGNMTLADNYVREAAIEAGYNTPKLYHGTKTFGFTVFDIMHSEIPGVIFTTTNEGVAHGYANFGRTRGASTKYIPDDGTDATLIRNAKNVLLRDIERLTDARRLEIFRELSQNFRKINGQIQSVDISEYYPPAEIENDFWNLLNVFDYLGSEYGEDYITNRGTYDPRDIGAEDLHEAWTRLRNYWSEHRSEIKAAGGAKVFGLILDYDIGDAAIDIDYQVRKLANEKDLFVSKDRANTNVNTRAEIQESVKQEATLGTYVGYGNLGNNPLEIDAKKSFWLNIPTPMFGDNATRSTDEIVKWARDNKYTSVIIRNVMDPAVVNAYGDDYVFFDNSQYKSADPITYDDDGNVIPLSERFNAAEDDIRRSRRVPYRLSDSEVLSGAAQIKGTNERENEVLGRYREEQKRVNELRAEMDNTGRLLDSAANTDVGRAYEKLVAEKDRLEKKIARKGEKLNEQEAKHYKEALDQIDMYRKKIAQNEGAIKAAKEAGRPEEAARLTRQNEALERSIGFAQQTVDAYGEDTHGKAQARLNEVNRQLAEMEKDPRVKNVVKLHQDIRNIRRAIAGANDRMKAMQQSSAMKGVIDRERQRILDNLGVGHGSEAQEYAKNIRNALDREHYRQMAVGIAKQLIKSINTEDKKNRIPHQLVEPLGEFLKRLDISEGRNTLEDRQIAESMTRLGLTMQQIEQGIETDSTVGQGMVDLAGWLDLPEGYAYQWNRIAQQVSEAAKKQGGILRNMSLDDMKSMAETLTVLRTAVNNANAFLAENRYRNANNAAQDTIDELAGFQERTKTTQAGDKLRSFFGWHNMTPYYAFKRMGKAAQAMFTELQDGWDKLNGHLDEIMAFRATAYTDQEVRAWEKETHEIKLPDGGFTVELTTAQIMSIYCLAKRGSAALQHMLTGGIRIDEHKSGSRTARNTTNIHVTMQDLGAICDVLTDRQIDVANKLQEFMSDTCAQWGNRVTMTMYGIRFFTEKNYFPMKTVDEGRNISTRETTPSLYKLMNQSFMNRLNPKASSALVIQDAFDVFTDHAANMAKMEALGLPMTDMLKWLNYNETHYDPKTNQRDDLSVRVSLKRAFGADAVDYIRTLIEDINGTSEAGRDYGTGGWLMARYKVASVAGNMRVVVQQPTSYWRAASMISNKYLIQALGTRLSGQAKKAIQEVGIAGWKSKGYYDTGIQRSMRSMIKSEGNWKDKVNDKLMSLAGKADDLTWGRIYTAVELETEDRLKKGEIDVEKDSDAWKKLVNDRMREIVYATQVVDSTLTRSQIMRAKGAWNKGLTAFMAEPTLTYSMIMSEIAGIMDDRQQGMSAGEIVRRHKGALIRTGAAVLASKLAVVLVQSVADAFRDDDDYETFLEKFTAALADNGLQEINPLTSIPVIKEAYNLLRGNDSGNMTGALFSDITKTIDMYAKALTGNGTGNRTAWGVVYQTVRTIDRALGTGTANVARDLSAVWNTATRTLGWDLQLQTYADAKSKGYDALMEAILSGDETRIKELQEELLSNGVEIDETQKGMATRIQKRYIEGEIDEETATAWMEEYGGYSGDKLEDKIAAATYQRETGNKWSAKKDDYLEGKISEEEAIEYLIKYGGKTKDAAYWMIREWEGRKKYDRLDAALVSGSDIEGAIKELRDHGVKEQTIKSSISSGIKEGYKEGTITGAKAQQLLTKYGGKTGQQAQKTVAGWK